MPRSIAVGMLAAVAALAPVSPWAFDQLDGYFIALQACPTGPSIAASRDPEMPKTEIRRAYEMLGKNKAAHTHFQIVMPEVAGETARWVDARCGVHATVATRPLGDGDGDSDGGGGSGHGNGSSNEPLVRPAATGQSTANLLTASWQPAFCEKAPGTAECQALNGGNLPHAAGQFSVHGLWPQPNGFFYCGVPESIEELDDRDTWHQLPAPMVDADTAQELARAMPGVASHLHHHQWIKHGTCYLPDAFGTDAADAYFDHTLWLMAQLNGSEVATLFAENVDAFVSGAEIRAAFDSAFGPGAGQRVRIACHTDHDSGRKLIIELWVYLSGTISEEADFGALMRAADPVRMDCAGGIVDPAGNQR